MEVFELDISHQEKVVELRVKLYEFEKGVADFNTKIPDIETIKEEISSLYNDDTIKLFGLMHSGEIIGYIVGNIENAARYIKDYTKTGYIAGIFIEESSRNMGGSGLLIEKMMDWFRSEDVHFIQLGVLTRNIGAIKAYKKYGFEEYYTKMKVII